MEPTMYSELNCTITGVSPLILHNGMLANPMSEIVQQIKTISSKRKKTLDDHRELARLEWHGSFYVNDDGHPVIPGENIEAMLIAAAKKNRRGTDFKSAMICDGNWKIDYKGPKSLDALWKDENFRHQTMMTVQRARILRTRPMFRQWSLTFNVHYLPDIIDEADLRQAMDIAGSIIGLGDSRPRFGRFNVSS